MRRPLTIKPRRQTARWMREQITARFIAEIEPSVPAHRRKRFRAQCRRAVRPRSVDICVAQPWDPATSLFGKSFKPLTGQGSTRQDWIEEGEED